MTGIRERIEEALRKHVNKDTMFIKHIGDDLRKPSPKAFRELVDWLLETINEVEELRSRVDSMGFTVNEMPSHHAHCLDVSCRFNENNKCKFVDFSGERIIRLNTQHQCLQYNKDPSWKDEPKAVVVDDETKPENNTRKDKKKKKGGNKNVDVKTEQVGPWTIITTKKK